MTEPAWQCVNCAELNTYDVRFCAWCGEERETQLEGDEDYE
jgi:rRNA maturation endonuclease Nob1